MTLARKLKQVVVRHLDDAPDDEILRIVSALCVEQPAPALICANEPAPPARFIKLDAAGGRMPADAAGWVAVYDSAHDLTWTRGNVAGGRKSWSDAKIAATAVDLLGAKDWRLPTIQELLSLVDYTRAQPSIDTGFFECQSNWYWSSTPDAQSPSVCAWYVYFFVGSSFRGDQHGEGFVRAVRAGQSLSLGF